VSALNQRPERSRHKDALRPLSIAPGSYDVLLDGVIIASLVRSSETSNAIWTAELLEDVHPRRRPAPSSGQSTRSAAWRKPRSGLEALRSMIQADTARPKDPISC
jgi:hypothetical protein